MSVGSNVLHANIKVLFVGTVVGNGIAWLLGSCSVLEIFSLYSSRLNDGQAWKETKPKHATVVEKREKRM